MRKILNIVLFLFGFSCRVIGSALKVFNFCLVIIGILFGSIKVITGVR